jgi:hypothetical protein
MMKTKEREREEEETKSLSRFIYESRVPLNIPFPFREGEGAVPRSRRLL